MGISRSTPTRKYSRLWGESPWILVGDEAQKVGAGSGWTRAAVTNACVFFRPGDAPSTAFLCQYAAQSIDGEPIAGPGDSGAPVFFWHPDHDAAMVGLLWSGTADRTSYAFSPMMNIHEELDSRVSTIERN